MCALCYILSHDTENGKDWADLLLQIIIIIIIILWFAHLYYLKARHMQNPARKMCYREA